MTYTVNIIPKQDQQTSRWSGGTTTQLSIYPNHADYGQRNFIWRLSSAAVEIEESEFTRLPGYWRHLMILEGELDIEHEGHHRIRLKPFEQDSFSGDWSTRSFGKVKDYNLMLAEGCHGKLEAIRLESGSTRTIECSWPEGSLVRWEAIYAAAGQMRIRMNGGRELDLAEGELLLVTSDDPNEHSVRIELAGAASAIRANLFMLS
ncbi:HutD/Ves family protein [Brevibacillus choshinensis]|uniref:HutD family protein n=1 Tax=Brevibacillus choshinensis TaxID=54911 RepID=A0ABX7FP06_BRECH|nr:HutD family protein [Brevibacillus choshinensis]QRG67966.1 HutD family protein [Brevibacillus choshinensis]